MQATDQNTSGVIAHWVSDLALSDVPADVIEQVKMCLADTLAVAVAGSRMPLAKKLLASGSRLRGTGNSRVLGGKKTGYCPEFAAQLNASCAHVLDFDDNSYAGFVHASAVVLPSAIALAQDTDSSGEDLLVALVAGLEAELIVGAMTDAVLYEKGWWTTGVLGAVGSVVSAAKLLRLPAEQVEYAIGLALCSAGGMKACFGTDAKAVGAGISSASGIKLAQLAALGVTGPTRGFESQAGFFSLFNNGVSDQAHLENIGRVWQILEPGFDIKGIPVCLSAHTAVAALAYLRTKHQFTDEDVEQITCDVSPIVTRNLIYDQPTTSQQAQFSMMYPMAVTLSRGHFQLKDLSIENVLDSAVARLMKKIKMITSDFWTPEVVKKYPEGATVSVRLKTGELLVEFLGSPQASTAQKKLILQRKLPECFEGFVEKEEQARFTEMISKLETFNSTAEILPRTHDAM